jgi:hypothetical protein
MTVIECSGRGIETNGLNDVIANLQTAIGETSLVNNRQQLEAAIYHINVAIFAGGSIPDVESLRPMASVIENGVEKHESTQEPIIETGSEMPASQEPVVMETPFGRANRLRNERLERSMHRSNSRPSIVTPVDHEPEVTAVCDHVLHGNVLPPDLKRSDVIKALKKLASKDGLKDRGATVRFRELNLALLGANNAAAEDFIYVSSNNAERSEIIGRKRSITTDVIPPDGSKL